MEGKTQAVRPSIADILEIRFHAVPSSLLQTLGGIEEPETLQLLHRLALRVESLQEFKDKMHQMLES